MLNISSTVILPTSTLLQISFSMSPFLAVDKTSLFLFPEGAKINGKGKTSFLYKPVLFTSFVYLPYYRITISKNEISYLNLVDKNILNILILGNFILILSFFDIKIADIIKSFYFLTLIALIFFWKDYKIKAIKERK